MTRHLASLALAAALLTPTTLLADPEYVSIEMEIDIDKSAEEVWARVGDYCAISDWLGLDCEITSGEGGMGTVRALAGGRILEILVAKTPLSYGYTQPAVEGQFYNLYHGFMEARPLTDSTSRMHYTLVLDVSNLPDQAAKDADVERRRNMFTNALANIKEFAEAP